MNGDDNPYVNMNITAGGVGNTRAKLITEYSSIDLMLGLTLILLVMHLLQIKFLLGMELLGFLLIKL